MFMQRILQDLIQIFAKPSFPHKETIQLKTI